MEKLISKIDVCAISKMSTLIKIKKFFAAHDIDVKCIDDGGGLDVSTLVLTAQNYHASILLANFVIHHEQEEYHLNWKFLEEWSPGISEFKDVWNCSEAEAFWNSWMSISDDMGENW